MGGEEGLGVTTGQPNLYKQDLSKLVSIKKSALPQPEQARSFQSVSPPECNLTNRTGRPPASLRGHFPISSPDAALFVSLITGNILHEDKSVSVARG